MMVSAHNCYVVAKAAHTAEMKESYPNFQAFVEDMSTGLIGDTTARRAAPMPEQPVRPFAKHEVVQMFQKKKTCKECSLSAAPGQRRGTTNYGCRLCKQPVHLSCEGAHINRQLHS